ncbi:helix-turn-helix domain-containing protein [Sulfurimonas sp.]|uniref:helix-turn-helix domain-containing protein n=1 Tax=Sulfurimonas sp. TaxID=2022749 RepID=UPI002637F256|nr:helix-turn-helix domain-containing protein [Sulfurimonas sp.]MCW8895541.1 helix-turn-helix domain-containing protein [Sulfurimonas sp.]MCW9067981.1 helix-turn-helix domain-containing protein [Sulfurimonas sp.]
MIESKEVSSLDSDKIKLIRQQSKVSSLIKALNEQKSKSESLEKKSQEVNMTKIQSKNNITVKEFAEIYNISKTSQQNYRARLHDPLPFHQKVEGGKIVYVVKEVEQWLENQHK